MDETVAVPVVSKVMLGVSLVTVADLDISRVVWMAGNEISNPEEVSLIHWVILNVYYRKVLEPMVYLIPYLHSMVLVGCVLLSTSSDQNLIWWGRWLCFSCHKKELLWCYGLCLT